VAAVEDLADLRIREELAEARDVDLGQRIDDEVFLAGRDLDEADLVEVRVQRIGLGVGGDHRLHREAIDHLVERRLFCDPLHSATTIPGRPMEISFSLYPCRSKATSAVSDCSPASSPASASSRAKSSGAGTLIVSSSNVVSCA